MVETWLIFKLTADANQALLRFEQLAERLSLAGVDHILNKLERVVLERLAEVLVGVEHVAEAVIIRWLDNKVIIVLSAKGCCEDRLGVFTVLHLGIKSLIDTLISSIALRKGPIVGKLCIASVNMRCCFWDV